MTVIAFPAASSTPSPSSAKEAREADVAAGAGTGKIIARSFERLAAALIDRAASAAVDKVDDLSEKLEGIASNGGVGLNAAFGAGTAMMLGKNPVVGAIKGAWSALGTGAKVGIVLGLILLAVLSPVALVLVLLGLLVAAIVKAART
ncbi:hypothetical protein [Actinomycetospora sp. TBRC 11914]|uniref:hypothetical protein n=1 Tax=Actinomycetospora sp. TBRC 11914 TaxID=2729387 RepID=UPI00145C6E55|nr:hypothetical protein [Actinomycetospora sp. TBRC 11914]NMO90466.1 hypothetical protein [Actinomycetospora sp. TBRC 11914]